MLDDVDRRILRGLQNDPSLPVSELAEKVRASIGITTRRLDRMRESGVLRGQNTVIDWRRLGYEAEVSLRFTLDKTNPKAFEEFIEAARDIPEVIEIQTFLGRVDVRLSVIARDMAHYQKIYREAILMLPHIAEIESLMQVAEIKNGGALPI